MATTFKDNIVGATARKTILVCLGGCELGMNSYDGKGSLDCGEEVVDRSVSGKGRMYWGGFACLLAEWLSRSVL